MTVCRTACVGFVLLALTGCDVRVQLGARDASVDGGELADAGTSLAGCPALDPLPSWRRGLTVGRWVLLSGTELNRVAPNPRPAGSLDARLSGPAGMAADTRTNTLYVAASGGNGDYSGNEVYRLRLADDAPSWELVTQPSPATAVVASQSHYADGRPSAAWGYYGTWFIEPIDQLLRFSAAGVWGAGGVYPTVDGWSAQSLTWLPARTHPSLPGMVLADMPTAKDFSTGDVYQHLGDNHLYRWNRATGFIEDLGRAGVGNGSFYEVNGSPLVFDPVRERLLYFSDDIAVDSVRVFDRRARTWSNLALTGDAGVSMRSPDGAMAFFDPCLGSVVVKLNDPNLLVLVDPERLVMTGWPTGGQTPPEPLVGVHTLPAPHGFLRHLIGAKIAPEVVDGEESEGRARSVHREEEGRGGDAVAEGRRPRHGVARTRRHRRDAVELA